MIRQPAKRWLLGAVGLAAAAGQFGCARMPPGSSSLSGVQLRVTVTYAGPMSSANYYFFLLNDAKNVAQLTAPGPVPVVGPPPASGLPSNGFATESGSDTNGKALGGFTDLVLFTNPANQFGPSQSSIALYHVPNQQSADSPPQSFQPNGLPIAFTPPGSNQDSAGVGSPYTLQFTIDLAQLILDDTGRPLADAAQADAAARSIQFLQLNLISTNLVATDLATQVNKQTDSMGNTSDGRGAFLTIPISVNGAIQPATYSDTMNGGVSQFGQQIAEPEGDVFVFQPNGSQVDPSLDMLHWTVEVLNNKP
ncbi:MAG: hypothetical protein KGJ62_09660 [Armatimonadetes bacterium]|nr:hypothetical protein [Armatimonadota bacterium]MDE2205788.1 hypothetical protein [Armatimonadota bacterium]